MTPEQKTARIKRLVSAAKALLTLQIGLFVGARRIENVLLSLESEFDKKHGIFAEFTNAVPRDIPIGSARLMWDSEAMLRTDLKLAPVEERFRSKLLAECAIIIRLYGGVTG